MNYLPFVLVSSLCVSTAFASISHVESEFKKLGLNNVAVTKVYSPRLKDLRHEQDRYYLKVNFGKLTRSQYNKLQTKFEGYSQVPYSSKRSYRLLDFLHPAMQAVANQTFQDKYYSMDGYFDYEEEPPLELYILERNGIGSFTNCWNTTLEITRMLTKGAKLSEQTFDLYWPGRWKTHDLLNNTEYGKEISKNELSFGDTVIVNSIAHSMGGQSYMLRHTAIALTPNLVFEKTDSGESDPYRISLLEDVTEKYEEIFTMENEMQLVFKRLSEKEKSEIPKHEMVEFFEPGLINLVQGHFPDVNLSLLSAGCDTRLGGGCDQILTEVHRSKLKIFSKTKRGILLAPQKVLKRFKGL